MSEHRKISVNKRYLPSAFDDSLTFIEKLNRLIHSVNEIIEEGIIGTQGKSIEFNWSGTRLGVRVEGDDSFKYVDLKGFEIKGSLDDISDLPKIAELNDAYIVDGDLYIYKEK